MKKSAILSLAVMGLTAGAFGQGEINLDNSTISPGFSVSSTGNYFAGTYGIEVWMLNSTTTQGLNGDANTAAYGALTTDGFKLEKTFTGQTITAVNAGVVTLGSVTMADVSPAGSTVDLALVMWTGSGSNPLTPSASGNSTAAGDMGVIEFVNATANPGAIPPPTPAPLSGWATLGSDLIMTPVPEPSIFALSSIGAAALMLIRRKK